MSACCTPTRYPVAGRWALRHNCKAKKGQPYDGDRRETERLRIAHRIEDAATGLDLHPVLQGSSVRDHFDTCRDDRCELCAYVWDHLDDADDGAVV